MWPAAIVLHGLLVGLDVVGSRVWSGDAPSGVPTTMGSPSYITIGDASDSERNTMSEQRPLNRFTVHIWTFVTHNEAVTEIYDAIRLALHRMLVTADGRQYSLRVQLVTILKDTPSGGRHGVIEIRFV